MPNTTIVICFVFCRLFLKSLLQTVWMQKGCLKRFQEDAADRRHKQMTFSDAGFLGILRVNTRFLKYDCKEFIEIFSVVKVLS